MNKRCVWFIIFSSLGFLLFLNQLSFSQNYRPAPQKQKKINSKKLIAPETKGDMVKIPAGVFGMGSYSGEGFTNELPYHPVYLDSFYIHVYEVTNMDYAQFLNAGENDRHYHLMMSDDQFLAGWDDFNPAISQNGYSENREQYNDVRSSRKKKYNDYHRQAKYAGMFVVGNHLLSIVDTIWGLKRHSVYRSRGL